MPGGSRRAELSRAVDRAGRGARRAQRPARNRRDPDAARPGGARRGAVDPPREPAGGGATPAQEAWLSDLRRQVEQGSERARARIAAIERLALQAGEFADMEYGFLYDKASRLLSIGYNVDERRRDASYYDLLASEARLERVRRHRPGAAAAGELVRPRAPAHQRRRRADPAVLERLDVRVPDAAAGDAELRAHAARPDRQGGGGAADRVRRAARPALGHVGIRLQHGGRASQLPVPRLRRARPGAETRAGRGPGRRALCLGAGADGGAGGGLPEPATARRRRGGRRSSAFTRPSTTPRRGSGAANPMPWCAPTWPITRA